MSEQKIQVGDKVRISYEGVVTDVNKYNEPMIDGGQYFYTDASRPLGEKYTAGKVEILEKRKPQALMSKYKTVMQKNRRAAFVLGITVAEYVTEHVWPKVKAKHEAKQ